MITKGNHVKQVHFVLLVKQKKNIFLLCQAMMRQSLALVSDISTIVKVSVTVISLSLDYSGYHKNLIQ